MGNHSPLGSLGCRPSIDPGKENESMRRWSFPLAVMAVAGAVVLLAGCAAPAAAPAKIAKEYTVRIGVFPVPEYLVHWVMKDKGFDKEFGLNLVEEQMQSGPAVNEALLAGAIDVGINGAPNVFIAGERGLMPDKVIAFMGTTVNDKERPHTAAIVGKGINSWKDLEGKNIGVNVRKSVFESGFRARFKLEGVKDAIFIEMPLPNLGAALAQGQLAALGCAEPFCALAVAKGQGRVLAWILGGGEPPLETYQPGIMVANANFYKSNPEAIKAFVRAQLKTVQYINEHFEEAKTIAGKALKLEDEVAKAIKWSKFPSEQRVDVKLAEALMKLMIDTEILKGPVSINKLYDAKLLEEVLKEKR